MTPQDHMLFKPLMAGTEGTVNAFKCCHLLVRDTMTSEPAELPTAGPIPSPPTVTHSVPSSPMALPAAGTPSNTPSDVSTSRSGRVIIMPVSYHQ